MNFKPLAGKAFIQPEDRFIDTGLIAIPEKYKKMKKALARIIDWEPNFRFRCNACGNVQHLGGNCRQCQLKRLKMISSVRTSPFDADIKGLRVLYVEAAVSMIDSDTFMIPIDDIVAIIGDDVVLDGAENENGVRRCLFCGGAKEGSPNGFILVDIKGKKTCPRCHRTEAGEVNKV